MVGMRLRLYDAMRSDGGNRLARRYPAASGAELPGVRLPYGCGVGDAARGGVITMPDYPDEDYELWCELNPCPECDGDGAIPDDGYGERTCRYCDGSGTDPNAEQE